MKKIIFLLGLLVGLLLVGCVPVEKQCAVDLDCIQATCCHPSEAVNKDYKPNCGGVLCTAVCEPGTLDCGQGEIKCVSGGCKIVLKE